MAGDPARPSALARLLEELSWEGNARPYREGGRGRENVLTTEVFAGLDLLPRKAFFGGVLLAAHGADAARAQLVALVEDAVLEVLPGDLSAVRSDGTTTSWTVQPDVRVETSKVLCLVEAKRLRSARFQRRQVARTLAALDHAANDRGQLLLLVVPDEPPLPVAGHGRLSITDAVELGLRDLDAVIGPGPPSASQLVDRIVAWITWDELQVVTGDAAKALDIPEPSVQASINRLAASVTSAIDWHR